MVFLCSVFFLGKKTPENCPVCHFDVKSASSKVQRIISYWLVVHMTNGNISTNHLETVVYWSLIQSYPSRSGPFALSPLLFTMKLQGIQCVFLNCNYFLHFLRFPLMSTFNKNKLYLNYYYYYFFDRRQPNRILCIVWATKENS